MRPQFRHIICACCCTLAVSACWRPTSPVLHYYKSPGYICIYNNLNSIKTYSNYTQDRSALLYIHTTYYTGAEAYLLSGDQNYYDLCVKYSDLKPGGHDCHTEGGEFFGIWAVAIAEAIDAIHITSSEDWDAEHAAGALLDDIFFAEYDSYYRYIRNNYTGEPVEHCRKPLADTRPGDMYLAHKISFNAETLPTVATQHTLTVEFLLDTEETVAYEAVVDFAEAHNN